MQNIAIMAILLSTRLWCGILVHQWVWLPSDLTFDYLQVNILVKDVTKTNHVVGIGTVIYKFQNVRGHDIFLPCIAYHLPTADIQLFSPQTYNQLLGFSSIVTGKQVIMHLKDQNIVIPNYSGPSNLPMTWNPSVSAKK